MAQQGWVEARIVRMFCTCIRGLVGGIVCIGNISSYTFYGWPQALRAVGIASITIAGQMLLVFIPR